MESPHNLGGNYWGTLINADKSPAPLFEQLCLGIAQLVAKLGSSTGCHDLTPDKLAAFYREVGGNYDTLFLGTNGPALSFIYQSLGCFHTLQPTSNPFEPPSVPALLPTGFVRWQVLQLLLCPDEHYQYLQGAVRRWDVPNANGGTFPKTLPREAFPAAPDQDMLAWHEKVSHRLEREYESRHTPHHSPGEFAQYYTAATGAREPRSAEAGDFFGDVPLRRPVPPAPRFRARSNDDIRRHRRRGSPEGRGPWPFRSGLGPERRAGDSRNSSPRARPSASPSEHIPLRSKTMRIPRNRDSPDAVKTSRRKHRSGAETSSDSSNHEEHLFTDESTPRRSHHLSPGREPPARRHSHDATSPRSDRRDRDPSYFPPTRNEREASHPRRYPSSKIKFQEQIFAEEGRSSYSRDQQWPHEINANVPRVQMQSDGSTPVDLRRNSHAGNMSPKRRRGSGSGGSDHARSFSNAAASAAAAATAWLPRWNSPSGAPRRRIPVYD